jgi:hypothetical protein
MYRPTVSTLDTRRVLWANVSALMTCHWGAENLGRLATSAGIGPATCTRLKKQETSVGVEIVDRIAEVFGLDTWQLLVPNLDPKNPPLLVLTAAERSFYRQVMSAAKDFKGT